MTPDILTPTEGTARPGRLSRIARKLGAVGVLAVALSFVRPCQVPGMTVERARHGAGLAAAPARDALPLPQVALLYREHVSASLLVVAAPSRDRLVGSVGRQVI